MTELNPVGWFEIPVTDMDRAEKFYLSVLDLEFQRQAEKDGYLMSWFPMVENGYGAAGMLMKGDGYIPSHEGSLVYFTTSDIEKTLSKVESAGGKILLPKTSIGEHGFISWVEDTEGNRVALHSRIG